MSHSSNLTFLVQPGGSLAGRLRVPGDKSISHRSIMLGSIAEGTTEISGFLEGEDSLATLKAFRAMGVSIEGPDNGRVVVHGVGLHGLTAPSQPLDLGNSGTSMRLLSGLLAGQSFDSELVGDSSLMSRPMRRVTGPLAQMGAVIAATGEGTAPLKISGGQRLQPIDYDMPVASAQVKSCLLLAGLYADGRTCVHEPAPTRDHTERMLAGMGYAVSRDSGVACLEGGGRLTATAIDVPADISSAAFFLVGASIAPGSDLVLEHVGINPTRTGVLEILKLMGADIELSNAREVGGEPVADLRVRSAPLHGIDIPVEQVPLAIDEFPALFVAAACAEGRTVLTGAAELRVKESDRIQVMADGLRALDVDAQATPDGMIIQGGAIGGGTVDSHGDHRIAMSFAMAALRASGPVIIEDCANVNTSFPGFVQLAKGAGLAIQSTDMSPDTHIPVIAIDGPSGSGKGTISRLLARELGYHFLDSGALYRLLAYAAERHGIALDDEPALAGLAGDLDIRFPAESDGDVVLLDGENVGTAIRTEAAGAGASRVAALPEVRKALLQRQRDFRISPGLVADGRDMGTVVFPDADLKIFLTASSEERARRRCNQLKEKNISSDYHAVLADIQARDERDSQRSVAPLRPAEDAIPVDTSELDIDATLRCARDLLKNRLNP